MMKKLTILFFLFTLHFSLLVSAYAEPPKRIISLAPNLTEILFAMGLGDRIVGVTNFCDHPEEAKKKPKIGGMSNPSLEAVVSLKPDIVIVTTDGNPKEFRDRLRSLNIKTYVFRARRLHELPEGIRDLGAVLDRREEANTLASEIESTINMFKERSRETKKKKVLFIIWPGPLIVAGSGTIVDDVITLLGAKNIASEAKTSYPKYSIEEIIHQSPDVIVIGKGHVNMEETSKGLLERISKVPAVENGAVYYISDSIYRLSPRIVKGIEEMARCLK